MGQIERMVSAVCVAAASASTSVAVAPSICPSNSPAAAVAPSLPAAAQPQVPVPFPPPLPMPFPRMRFRDALNDYGSDKPDIRFGLEIADVSHVFRQFAMSSASLLVSPDSGAAASPSDPLLAACLEADPGCFSPDAAADAAEAARTAHLRARDVAPCVKALVIRGLSFPGSPSTLKVGAGKGKGAAGKSDASSPASAAAASTFPGEATSSSRLNKKALEALLKTEAQLAGCKGLLPVWLPSPSSPSSPPSSSPSPSSAGAAEGGTEGTLWKAPAAFASFADPSVQRGLTEALLSPSRPSASAPASASAAAGEQTLVCFVSGEWESSCLSLGRVRSALIRLFLEGKIAIPGIHDNAFARRHNMASVGGSAADAGAGDNGAAGAGAGAVRPRFHWVVDFPLFEVRTSAAPHSSTSDRPSSSSHPAAAPTAASEDPTSKAFALPLVQATHHPFTAPHPDDLATLQEIVHATVSPSAPSIPSSPSSGPALEVLPAAPGQAPARRLTRQQLERLAQVRALHYDLVSNGLEVGGGSIRLHQAPMQEAVFRLLNVGNNQFQHLLEALRLGAPPHGGFAAGLDRLVAILGAKGEFAPPLRLREVIAFPKTLTGSDLLLGSPAPATAAQLAEYGIDVVVPVAGAVAV